MKYKDIFMKVQKIKTLPSLKIKTEISVILQIASLHPEPAPGAAELRPLAASIGQEPVPPRPIKALPTNGDLFVSVTSSLIWWIIAFINETDSEIWLTETCGRFMVVMTTEDDWLILWWMFQDDVISAQDALPQKTPLTLSDEPRWGGGA